MKIRDVMTPDIEVVAPEDTLTTAAQLMADLDFEVLPVSENDRLAGMITGRDIAMRVVADGCDPKQVTVVQAMTCDALYCFENEHVKTVSQKMADWWVRRLPVVNQDKRLIGMVSLADLTAPNAARRPREVGVPSPSRRLRAARPARLTRGARRTTVAA